MRLAPLLLTLAATPLLAMETPITGTRQLGMGASGTATTEDHTVVWWNAAALGWDSGAEGGPQAGFGSIAPGGIGIEANAGFHAYGELLENANDLLRAAARIKELGASGIADQASLRSFLTIAGRLNDLADPADTLMAFGNVAGSMRLGRFAIGVRWSAEASAFADDLDLRNVIPQVNGANLATQINASGQTFDATLQVLDTSQRDQIYQALGGTGAFGTVAAAADATLRIDDALRDLGAAAPAAAEAATFLAATASGSGTIDQNTTSVVVNGFSYVEIPVGIGMPINEYVAVGGCLKLMSGRVNGTRILVFQEDVEGAVADLKGAYKDSLNLGVDLGLQAKAGSWRMGINATNLNSPTFAGPDNPDGPVKSVRLDPQVTIGVGWRPSDWFTLAADIEQFEVGTINPVVRSRRAGAGFEFAAIPWLDLRGGVYGNLADSHAPPVITAGAGFGPEAFRLDAAVACASELQDFGQWSLPTELRVAIGLSGRW